MKIVKNLCVRICFVAMAMAFSVLTARALVPDPGNVYYGLAKDFLGRELKPEDNAEVVLIRIDAGSEIVLARSSILAINAGSQSSPVKVNYILRPALDDGLASRFEASAGRKDDAVAIYIIHNGVRYETYSKNGKCSPVGDPVPAIGERGTIRKIDFRCIDDWDGDCIADSWERLFLGTTEFSGSDDWDDDGINDLAEFVRGTDPLESNASIAVIDFQVPNLVISIPRPGIAKLEWMKQDGLVYEIEWSGTLDGFQPVPADRIGGASGNEVNVTGLSKRFFRVKITR